MSVTDVFDQILFVSLFMCKTGRSRRRPERQQLCRRHQQPAAGGKRSSAGTRHGGWAARPCRRTNHRQL